MFQLKTFLKDEAGATSIEYAFIAGLISIAIVTAAGSVGTSVAGVFGSLSSTLDSAVS